MHLLNSNPDTPEPKKKLITKARKDENPKRRKDKFRVFHISCFRDEKIFSYILRLVYQRLEHFFEGRGCRGIFEACNASINHLGGGVKLAWQAGLAEGG